MSAIAIVGMGCRFAGAPDLQAYWKMTLEGRNGFGPVPADRWDADAFFDTNRRATDKSYAPRGGFIDDIRSFPALAMGIPPRRVEVMDPQQRFAIEVALQAIEDAGYHPSEMPYRTGVYMGVTASEFRQLLSSRVTAQLMGSGDLGEAPEDLDAIAGAVRNVVPSRPFTAPGVLANMIAAAVAQELDLHGPAYTLDAACASAMMALFDAVAQLRSGAIDAAVAGGVYLCVTPENHIAFSRIGAMSAQGECLPFDERADGFIQGDGAGAIILKRLEDANRDGDRIYAVIRGIAINNDGRGDGPMAPIQRGQTDCVNTAWKDSGLDKTRVGYVETHGTGTTVGDLIEFQALATAFGDEIADVQLGSSKANVGHTMSAAAIAGVIRTALAIHHEQIPPMAGFETPKADLNLAESRFDVPTEAHSWDGDRFAGVSSFGFGGTNGHAVLTSAPNRTSHTEEQFEIVQLSAENEASLADIAGATARAMETDPTLTVAGVARAWAVRKSLPARLAIVADSRESLLADLRIAAAGNFPKGAAMGTSSGRPTLAFLFPGQGAQRIGMLRDLAERFAVVRDALDELERDLADDLSLPLTHLLFPERRKTPVDDATATAELTQTENCQPVLFACAEALRRLLESVGIKPDIATGHSLGEFNAAVAGGVLDPAQAARFTARRGAAMAAVNGDQGAMVALRTGEGDARRLLVEGAVLANVNHPDQVVVSGTTSAIATVAENAAAAGVTATALDVSHAFHSPLFADLDLAPLLEDLDIAEPAITVASCISDHPYASAAEAREVFARHARSPVQFLGALEQCRDDGADLYLQVGSGGPLASFARKAVGQDARAVLTLAKLDDADGGRSLLETLGWLWVHGVDIDARPVTGPSLVASVPPIALPRETYWAVKAKKQLTLKLKRGADRGPVADEPAAEETAPEGVTDDVYGKVVDVVARVSSYPRNAVQPTLTLIDDLGFDSLMVADLATGLADAFPGLGGLPQELLINRPTVEDISEYVKGAERGLGDAADDDDPLTAYEWTWVPTPFPIETIEVLQTKGSVVGTGAVADHIRGYIVEDAEPEVLVWVVGDENVPVSAVLSGESDWIDLAGPFIEALAAHADRKPDVLLVRSADNPWAEALTGVVRAIAREWPTAICKSISLGKIDPEIAMHQILREWRSADISVDVRHDSDGRFVMGMQPRGLADTETVGGDDTVLITGGTRGIGVQLATSLAGSGARILLAGRGDPSDEAAALIAANDRISHVRADVTDRAALEAAIEGPVTVVIHCAGVLADGAVDEVDAEKGRLARAVKAAGWLNALGVAGANLRIALGIGSWAGRFGNRHQAHYAAGNALMSALTEHVQPGARAAVAEFGPWSSSEMVQTIPVAIQSAMRADGIDFVGDDAGISALLGALASGSAGLVYGRNLPWTTRARTYEETLSVETHPYLTDHAIDGTPIFPLAGAADLLAHVAGVPAPFEVRDLKLYAGISVKEPVRVKATIRGERAEIRFGEKDALAYRARVAPAVTREIPAPLEGGGGSELSVADFYADVTFHGPLLAGIRSIDGVGTDFARGRIRGGLPAEWIPATSREAWTVDPLALDSAMQLSAMVAWSRYKRAGTPVGIGRYVQLAAAPDGDISVDVHFGEAADDRFSANFVLRDAAGEPFALIEDAVAELRAVAGEEEAFIPKREWFDPSTWAEVNDLKMRLQAAEAIGIRNPFFQVHEGTARDTTRVGGRELINYSSYNYIGLSGDPRVLDDVERAVRMYGTSVSASRVASGERPFHIELERLLSESQGVDEALVFTAGHATNVTTIGHLFGPGDLVLHDELIHDSALQGIKLSGAGRRGFRHDDPEHLEELLKSMRRHHEKVLIIIEGVYSMDGDICQLPAYVELKKKYGAMLMVDEAHSFGIIGERGCGLSEHWGIPGNEVDLWMGTLSKSLASCGGWIAGSEPLITYLRYTAPGFVYSAGITPANGQAALSSLKLMLEERWRVEKLQANAKTFHTALVARDLDTGPALGGSAVIPVVTGNSMHALMLSQRLQDQDINVQPIVYPAVADDAARLRFFLSSTHSTEQLEHTAKTVADTLAGVRKEFALP